MYHLVYHGTVNTILSKHMPLMNVRLRIIKKFYLTNNNIIVHIYLYFALGCRWWCINLVLFYWDIIFSVHADRKLIMSEAIR